MQLTVSAYAIEPSFIMMGTAGSYGIEELIFDFSTEWDDLTKIVSFFPAGHSERVDVYLTEDACRVPHEFTAHSGIAVMTIQGIKDGVSRLTVTADVGITATMPPATNPPLPPSPTLVEQLIAIAQEADATAQSVREDADAGVFDGKPAYPVKNVTSAAEVTAIQTDIASGEYSADTAYAFVSTAFGVYTVGDMLAITENDVSVAFHFAGTDKPYLSIERVSQYLYNVSFLNVADDAGVPSTFGGCSSYVKDGKLYRNFDFHYDNKATFHVRLPHIEGLACIDGLTDTNIDDRLVGQLPYHLTDGVNDNGIMVSTHILYNDWEFEGSGNIPLTKLPYLVLKNAKSIATLNDDIGDLLADVLVPQAMADAEYLMQILITDGTNTSLLTPKTDGSGEYEIIDITSNPKLTNFKWVDSQIVDRAELQTRPTGVERWNMMPYDLSELRFTYAYVTPDRLSEFIGIRGTTKDSSDVELLSIYFEAYAAYESRTRDGETWHTMHSVVYTPNGIEHLWIQEDFGKDYAGVSEFRFSDGAVPLFTVKNTSEMAFCQQWAVAQGYTYIRMLCLETIVPPLYIKGNIVTYFTDGTSSSTETLVDQYYNPNSPNAQSGTAVLDALGSHLLCISSTAEFTKSHGLCMWVGADNTSFTYTDMHDYEEKTVVLNKGELWGIAWEGGMGHYRYIFNFVDSIHNVDQIYDPESPNAQSGTAVAQAIANKADKSIPETITILTSSWSALAESDPFKYSATATITETLDSTKTVTLINNAPVMFAKYGFQISAISGQNVTIIATEIPDISIALTVEVK